MSTERSIEAIEKFPADPQAKIVYVVYNRDMVRATESLIAEVHGKQYRDEHVRVVPMGNNLSFAEPCSIYFDPALHDYKGNGYN